MGANSRERRTRIHELELEHRDNIHKTEAISRDEEARLLRLRLLTSRDENAALKDKISQKDARIAALVKKSDQIRVELDESKEAARALETRMKKQNIELANLKAEVTCLNGSMQDSGKALQEKFALTRELNRLRPEMEHLQSQLANYQAMVAEKNDLRRQLDSLEVELENEKRSRQRVRFKEDDAAMAELKSRLEQAEKKVAADQKERDRAKQEHERELAEARALSERLEARVESLKAKYKGSQSTARETREQLARCQAELEKATKMAPRGTKEPVKKSVTIESGLNRKRRVQEMSYEDITIQTPGNEDKRIAAKKRSAAEQATVGEKSTFSITPFLSRTKNLSDESLDASAANDMLDPELVDHGGGTDPEAREDREHSPSSATEEAARPRRKAVRIKVPTKVPTKGAAKGPPKPRGRPRTKGLAEASPAQANRVTAQAAGTKAQEMVADEQENVSAKAACRKAAPVLQPPKPPEGDIKARKKRKLLGGGQPLLGGDEDGEEAVAAVAKAAAVAPGKRSRAQLGGGVRNAFAGASFSPLKRDRRGANASFLA